MDLTSAPSAPGTLKRRPKPSNKEWGSLKARKAALPLQMSQTFVLHYKMSHLHLRERLTCVSRDSLLYSTQPNGYSYEPACGERTLQCTPRQTIPVPSGAYTNKGGGITVTLFEQPHGVDMPIYGRRGTIHGTVYLEDLDRITQVSVKVEGKLDTIISEGGSKSITLLSRGSTLWRKGTSEEFPNLIPFSCVLPPTFRYNDSETYLPPTYRASHPGFPAFFIRINYSISIYVTRARHRNMEFLTRVDEVKIPFNYYPRTRAHRPILTSPGFFSTVKTSPEEWYQAFTEMKTRSSVEVGPIYFHLFLPSARAYGLTDKIPFHVQLNGPLDSLQKLLMPQPANAPPLPSWSAKKSHEKCPLHAMPKIRVYILRQSHIETRGQRVFRNTTVAEGEIWELPPAICDGRCDSVHLDWEGELRMQPEVTAGGFVAGNVTVKDFIVLSVEPPTVDNHPSPFLALLLTVPIRLVTDSWLDTTDYETQAT
ncbi:hypothetical protein LshimejAT787_0504830 [Lyophyllum shimeji]|uniref:Uncharacterized protein n=1 Tax=Lyophyllum shimeji TaxID=47721 RepID=A0A9P3UMG0_LYOSH|nr:hypothetical protein LshimejAT787_0504830 [Lyophyllum shimeji]